MSGGSPRPASARRNLRSARQIQAAEALAVKPLTSTAAWAARKHRPRARRARLCAALRGELPESHRVLRGEPRAAACNAESAGHRRGAGAPRAGGLPWPQLGAGSEACIARISPSPRRSVTRAEWCAAWVRWPHWRSPAASIGVAWRVWGARAAPPGCAWTAVPASRANCCQTPGGCPARICRRWVLPPPGLAAASSGLDQAADLGVELLDRIAPPAEPLRPRRLRADARNRSGYVGGPGPHEPPDRRGVRRGATHHRYARRANSGQTGLCARAQVGAWAASQGLPITADGKDR